MVNESAMSVPPSAKKHLSYHRRQIYLQMVIGAVILFCGIVIGSGATLLHLKDRMIMRGPRPPLPDIVEDMQGRYDLTDEQAKKVEDIFRRRRETMHDLFEDSRQKIEAEFQKISSEIKEILTPEQYERWENDFKSRRRGPGGFGPGGPGRRGPGQGGFGPGRRDPGRFGPDRPEPREPNTPDR
ncbi:MAG: hypothetical protein JW837_11685 [Sedimentisphaerales bacterium]|nr:hypothetical protein [Sedimentisphaerales bacterium]